MSVDFPGNRGISQGTDLVDSRLESREVWLALGSMHFDAMQYQEAAAVYGRLVVLDPENIKARLGIGTALLALGKARDAITQFEAALSTAPDCVEAHTYLGYAYHLLDDTERGWDEFAWMLQACRGRHDIHDRLWDGSPLVGRTILLWTNQGRGDTIQCLRYVRFALERGANVIVECHHSGLIPLIEGIPGVKHVVRVGSTIPFDLHAPLVYLPALVRESRLQRHDDVPYLSVPRALIDEWQRRLGTSGKVRIGVSWAGNEKHRGARSRFVPLAAFEALASVPGVRLISLQHGAQASELVGVSARFSVEKLHEDEFPILDAAALILNLDVVVTVDTMIAHLAGALGRPVWTLLRYAPSWRWKLQGARTPWYPTMRLFRQNQPGEWSHVFEQVRAAAQEVAQRRV